MSPIRFHVAAPDVARIRSWCDRRIGRAEQIAMPNGSAVFVVIPSGPYDRHEIARLAGAALFPHPHSPVAIGALAERFPHVTGLHAAMTSYELHAALHQHPAHPHPLLDPELG